MTWSNDYPNWESSWPRSREYIERNFQGLSDEIKRKITWDNVARLYDLDSPALSSGKSKRSPPLAAGIFYWTLPQ
jgi:hypothetical protein